MNLFAFDFKDPRISPSRKCVAFVTVQKIRNRSPQKRSGGIDYMGPSAAIGEQHAEDIECAAPRDITQRP